MTSINSNAPLQNTTPTAAPKTSSPPPPRPTTSEPDAFKDIDGVFSTDTSTWITQSGMASNKIDFGFDDNDTYGPVDTRAQRLEELNRDINGKSDDDMADRFSPYRTKISGERGEKLEFFNRGISDDKALISFEARMPNYHDRLKAEMDTANSWGQEQYTPVGKPKIRSPYLKQLGRDLGDSLIKDPLQAAWDNKDFTSSDSLKAMGWTAGLLTAAVMSPADIKSSIKIADKDIAGYNVGLKTSIRSGDGDIKPSSVGLRFRPEEQNASAPWNAELKYDFEDDNVRFTWSKTLKEGSGHRAPRTDFRVDVFHGNRERDDRFGQRERVKESSINIGLHSRF